MELLVTEGDFYVHGNKYGEHRVREQQRQQTESSRRKKSNRFSTWLG